MKVGLAAMIAGLLLVGCSPEEAAPTTEAPVSTLSTVPTTSTTTARATATAPPTSISAPTSVETTTMATTGPAPVTGVEEFPIPGRRPHDVAVAPDGRVWYTAQRSGSLDRLDPATGEVEQVPLGAGAAPHGVIVGPDGAAWVTDHGLNALVRVDHDSLAVDVFPASADVSMHTAAFASDGILWFTGQAAYVGRFDPAAGQMDLFETGGGGPYGITVTPDGDVYYAALAGSYIARVDPATGEITRIHPPTADQGARRVWTDSGGRIWVSYWNTGHLALYDPGAGSWQEWRLPGESPQAYAVYVDETDRPWVSDFGGNHALLRFDPATRPSSRSSCPPRAERCVRSWAVPVRCGAPSRLPTPSSSSATGADPFSRQNCAP